MIMKDFWTFNKWKWIVERGLLKKETSWIDLKHAIYGTACKLKLSFYSSNCWAHYKLISRIAFKVVMNLWHFMSNKMFYKFDYPNYANEL